MSDLYEKVISQMSGPETCSPKKKLDPILETHKKALMLIWQVWCSPVRNAIFQRPRDPNPIGASFIHFLLFFRQKAIYTAR